MAQVCDNPDATLVNRRSPPTGAGVEARELTAFPS
jgi:hypothetical protein